MTPANRIRVVRLSLDMLAARFSQRIGAGMSFNPGECGQMADYLERLTLQLGIAEADLCVAPEEPPLAARPPSAPPAGGGPKGARLRLVAPSDGSDAS